MPQVRKVEDAELMQRLARIFKDVGYEAASLAVLANATGLKKASLYHRFPLGKEQMAEEVLAFTNQILDTHVFPVLSDETRPEKKMSSFVRVIDEFYLNGNESCLLNLLCPPRGEESTRAKAIAATFKRLIDALTRVAEETGAPKKLAKARAEHALVELHGALVLARATGDDKVFQRMLTRLPAIILASES